MTQTSRTPNVVISMVLYNHAHQLPEAIESLLTQTYQDLRLLLIDDASYDDTPEVAWRYVEADSRVSYHRNDERRGMIGNWRHACELAKRLYPDATYFAWASDHDVWHPLWLESLVKALDRHPRAVLAYSQHQILNDDGDVIELRTERLNVPSLPGLDVRRYYARSWTFQTVGVTDQRERLRRAVFDMSAGKMIYGLYRQRAVRSNMLHHALRPDRLLLSQLALIGEFVQVSEALRYTRARGGSFSLKRQRTAWGGASGRLPYVLSYLPSWLVHALVFVRDYTFLGRGGQEVSRAAGVSIAARLAAWNARHDSQRWLDRFKKKMEKQLYQRRQARRRLLALADSARAVVG